MLTKVGNALVPMHDGCGGAIFVTPDGPIVCDRCGQEFLLNRTTGTLISKPRRTRVRKKDFFQGLHNANTRRVTAFLTVREHDELKDFLLWMKRQTGMRMPEGVYLARILEICTPRLRKALRAVQPGDDAAAKVEAIFRNLGEG